MDSDVILKMQNICKTFPGVVALENINFDLRRGEVHILLGENGAGKSTLVKILSGAYQKTSGDILFENKEIEIKNPGHAQDLGIAIIYQELNLVSHLSAAENILLGREPLHVPGIINRSRLYRSTQKILDGLQVQISSRSLVKELGVAEQQMVEVAKALSLHAKILIMDEPTSALTEKEIEELFKTINRLKKSGTSIIYISHRLEELFEIGDRVTVLRDGKYVGTHNIQETTKEELIRKMVDRELTEQFPKRRIERGEEVLRVENLKIDDKLSNINFSLHRGEVLGISGLLGSGRTELARAIFGADKIDSGKIYVKGVQQNIKSPRNSINLGIGLLTEDRKSQGLILDLSLKDNVCLPNLDQFSKFGVVSSNQENSTAAKYIDELRIKTPGLNQKVLYLSGGNQQKVVISKWLCSHADILIFDEPTRGIDVGSKVEIYQLMNQLTAHGAAIIMISSELPEILGMSDRILVMHHGEINGEFAAEEATQEKILHCALGV
ncbi:ATP-binding cassette domain-containing protein [candidate division KSB1 bacterium]|nr:ATP-binding cassette domain-containing protein [candidate division KSB1 bacterium]